MGSEVLLSSALRCMTRLVLQLTHHVSSTVELVLLASADKSSILFPPHRALQITHASSDLCDLAELLAGVAKSRRWQTHLHLQNHELAQFYCPEEIDAQVACKAQFFPKPGFPKRHWEVGHAVIVEEALSGPMQKVCRVTVLI
jgi:hypothetical protein